MAVPILPDLQLPKRNRALSNQSQQNFVVDLIGHPVLDDSLQVILPPRQKCNILTVGSSRRELLRATGEPPGGVGAAQEDLPKDEHNTLAHLMQFQFIRVGSAIVIYHNSTTCVKIN